MIHPNTLKLRNLMLDNGLSIKDVAATLERKYNTVKCWRCQSGVVIPDSLLLLLELKVSLSKGVDND